MPIMNFMFAGDADAVISYLNYAHDNCALVFDAWHNGTNWVSSHAGANWAIYKTGSNLVFGYNAGTAKGSTFAAFNTTDGLVLGYTGNIQFGKQLYSKSYSLTVPAYSFNGGVGTPGTDYGIGYYASGTPGNLLFFAGGVPVAIITPGTFKNYRVPSDWTYSWSSLATNLAASDTGLSRISAALVGIGNGTGGDFTGSLKCASATLTTSLTISALSTAGILHNSAAGLISTSLIVAADIGAVVNTSVIPKGGAANASLVASSITDDGTTVKTTLALGVGTSSTPTTAGVIRCDTGLGVGVDPTSTRIGNFQKDANAFTQLYLTNVNNHASAGSEIAVLSHTGSANYISIMSCPALGTGIGTAGWSGIRSVNTSGFVIRNTSNTDMTFKTNDTLRMTIAAAGYVSLHVIHAGATQAAAGAAANEIWKTSGHATLPDNVLMIGV
jgi:hypothetical protein